MSDWVLCRYDNGQQYLFNTATNLKVWFDAVRDILNFVDLNDRFRSFSTTENPSLKTWYDNVIKTLVPKVDSVVTPKAETFKDLVEICRAFVTGYIASTKLDPKDQSDIALLISSMTQENLDNFETEGVLATLAQMLFPEHSKTVTGPSGWQEDNESS